MEDKTKRLFTALRFNSQTIEEISLIQNKLKEIDPKAKYVFPISNFHLTLFFIGMVKEKQIPEIEDAFQTAIDNYRNTINQPIQIIFTQLGKFIKRNNNVIWLGIEENKDLLTLSDLIQKELLSKFNNLKKQKFKAHITLARNYKGEFPENFSLPENIEIDKAALVWSHRNKNNLLVYDNILKSALIK